MLLIGVDVGGTFTDCVFFDKQTGDIAVTKVPSTPGNEEQGAMLGLEAFGIDLSNDL